MKKMEKSKLVIISIVIIFIMGLNAWQYYNYSTEINNYSIEIGTLQSQMNTLQSQLDSLNTTYQDYLSIHIYSNSEYNSLNTTYQDYLSIHSYNNSEYNSLNTTYQDYLSIHSYNNSEYNTLQSQIQTLNAQIDALETPKLIKVNLNSDDHRPFLGTPHLRVYGEIVNVGTNTAYNCKLHVFGYQGSVVAIDTYILLGTIGGRSWMSVDENLYYSGEALTSWSIIQEFTS